MPETLERLTCPECSAPLGTVDLFCWMCHRRLREEKGKPPTVVQALRSHPLADAPPAQSRPVENDLFKTRRFLLPFFFVVAAGFAINGPGMAALAVILCLPAYFSLAFSQTLKARSKQEQKPEAGPATWSDRIGALFDAALRTFAVLIMVFIAVSFALAATCFFLIALSGGG